MSWITLDADAVLEQFNATERAAVEGVQESENGLPGLISSVTKQVRGYVARRNPVASDETQLPDELKADAIAIIRYRFLNSLPGLEDLITKGREKEYSDALVTLRAVAAGNGPAIEPPAEVSTAQEVDSPAPRFSSTRRRRRFNDCNQDGI
jgi:hypothetical protein